MIKLKKSAFVVENDPIFATSISSQLEKSGYDVKLFSSGQRALSQLCASLDLIVLDHDLGEQESGLQYLKEIKNTTPNVPVFFLSQQNNVEAASQALWSGASYYIEKNGSLKERLQSALDYLDVTRKSKFKSALISFRKGIFSLYNF